MRDPRPRTRGRAQPAARLLPSSRAFAPRSGSVGQGVQWRRRQRESLWSLRHASAQLLGPPFSGSLSVLVYANDRCIDVIRHPVSPLGQLPKYPPPDPLTSPPPEPRVDALPWAVLARQVPPRRSAAQNPQYPVHHRPVRLGGPRLPATLRRQHSLQPSPLLVREFVSTSHPGIERPFGVSRKLSTTLATRPSSSAPRPLAGGGR
jgi:hypothetical protein